MRLRASIAVGVAFALGAAAPAAQAAIPTLNVRSAERIRDDPKVPARIKAGGRVISAEIEYRGSSTLMFPKKPYAIEPDAAARRARAHGGAPARAGVEPPPPRALARQRPLPRRLPADGARRAEQAARAG
jgi:hypothetical protein